MENELEEEVLDENLYTTYKNHNENIEKIINLAINNNCEDTEDFDLLELLYMSPEETEKLNNRIDTKYIIALLELIYTKLV